MFSSIYDTVQPLFQFLHFLFEITFEAALPEDLHVPASTFQLGRVSSVPAMIPLDLVPPEINIALRDG